MANSKSPVDRLREQYEAYPYPPRDPAEESQRLHRTSLDCLPLLNHYCFGGALGLDGFRALVAGGGTGDAAVYLGEQLRNHRAEIVFVEPSGRSLDIARRRADARGLDNITWVQAGIEDLQDVLDEPADYINCSGVLHHTPSPQHFLARLASVLKPTGAIGLMVYSRHARQAITQLQHAIQHLTSHITEIEQGIPIVRALIDQLPPYNLFRRERLRHMPELSSGDAALVDLLLNPIEHPFSVPELYELARATDLHLVEFVGPVGQKIFYDPDFFLDDPALRAATRGLPRDQRQDIADVIGLQSANHTVYLSAQSESTIDWTRDAIPGYFPRGAFLSRYFERLARAQAGESALPIAIPGTPCERIVHVDSLDARLLGKIDNRKTAGEIADQGAKDAGTTAEHAWARLTTLYARFSATDSILLRKQEFPTELADSS